MERTDAGVAEEVPSPKRPHRRHATTPRRADERLVALRDALRAARQGDFSVRLPAERAGAGVLAEVMLEFNALVERNDDLVCELDRVARSVGERGNTEERASLPSAGLAWSVAVSS